MTTSCPTCGAFLRGGPRYPLATLLNMMGYQSVNKAAEALGVSGTTYVRYSCHGVTERTADRLAVRAGFHPLEVWPELADHQFEDVSKECARERCQERFVPARRNQRYCSRECTNRESSRRYMARRYAKDPRPHLAAVAAYYAAHSEGIKRAQRRRYAATKRAAA